MNLDKQILEELEKFKLMSSYSPKKTLTENINEQATPGGVKQAAIDKILVFSNNNKSRQRGSYLFPAQQSEIDKEFGAGTYNKFFNGGGKDILDGKKIEPEQKSTKPEIEIPGGISKEAVDKILVFSNNNKSRQRGSYLFPAQQSEIDKEFGAGTYDKFFNGGGRDVLDGKKTFKTSVNVNITPRQQNINNAYCSVKQGVITTGGVWNGRKWADYIIGVNPKVSAEEIKMARKSCPTSELSKTSTKTAWKAEPANLDDAANTLKKGMKGDKIKLLQQKLDIKGKNNQSLITGNFWDYTDTALMQKYPNEYTTEKGVTKTLFDKITGNAQPTSQNDVAKNEPGYKPKGLPTVDKSKFDYLNAPATSTDYSNVGKP